MTNEAVLEDNTAMSLTDYLAKGGKLSSPNNVPPRYRGELLRLMSSFVDSELAGSAGFADAINWAPGLKERIAASRITLEKVDHAEQVLDLMTDFGTDKALYNKAHSWSARQSRDAHVDPKRQGGDMRLSVFHYPMQGWADAVVMNFLMGLATVHQLKELSQTSYQPLGEVFRKILPREQRHMELGLEGLQALAGNETDRAEALASVGYWMPRVAETFGPAQSGRFDRLKEMGLRQTDNETLRAAWKADVDARLAELKLI
ncbi:Phenylacetic acid catabolic protein [Labrenzia sp. PHM005]|uniref:Phenylacetic acid catabolic protein n=1 Tax=Labrenzia sp. PHM005 TaxID=2590016 RepID=UPI0011400AC2|nr:Phenylacetic acid catabolic protein [Labrenzia sp. PHM005]QDG75997.1 phenylacetic acid catabolic [Labrenzia sp. PHM005]